MTVSPVRYTLLILLGAALCACAETPDARDGGSGAIEDAASDAQLDATHDADVAGDADSGRCPEDPFEPFSGLQNPIPGCPCPTPGEQYCCIGTIECTQAGTWGPFKTDDPSACSFDADSGVIPQHLECI